MDGNLINIDGYDGASYGRKCLYVLNKNFPGKNKINHCSSWNVPSTLRKFCLKHITWAGHEWHPHAMTLCVWSLTTQRKSKSR